MNRMLGFAVLALLAAGCATNSAVKEKIDPLSERLTAVEQKNAALESKVSELNRRLDAQVGDMQTAQKNLADSTTASQKAQQAAADAQAAAARAETAADKAAKAFELKQRKGAR